MSEVKSYEVWFELDGSSSDVEATSPKEAIEIVLQKIADGPDAGYLIESDVTDIFLECDGKEYHAKVEASIVKISVDEVE